MRTFSYGTKPGATRNSVKLTTIADAHRAAATKTATRISQSHLIYARKTIKKRENEESGQSGERGRWMAYSTLSQTLDFSRSRQSPRHADITARAAKRTKNRRGHSDCRDREWRK